MTIRIYDFDDNAVKIENPDKPIKRIDVIVLSGDETGTIRIEDGTRFDFNAPDDRDTELEYIESSGTQYVDTGVVPNNKGGVHYIDKNRIEAAVKTLRRRTERGEERNQRSIEMDELIVPHSEPSIVPVNVTTMNGTSKRGKEDSND